MQGILTTTLSVFNKMPCRNEKQSKESQENRSPIRENLLPITSLHEQIIEHLNQGDKISIDHALSLDDKKNTIKAISELNKNGDSAAMAAGSGMVETATPLLFSEKSIKASQTHVIKKRDALLATEGAGQEHIMLFLQQNGLIDAFSSGQHSEKEQVISALAKYLYTETSDGETQSQKQRKVARAILASANLYGGVNGESVSPGMAKTVIKEWLFRQVLASSLEKYIFDKMVSSEYPSYFSVDSLSVIFDMNKLIEEGRINVGNLDAEQRNDLNVMWEDYLNHELPFLQSQDKNIITMSLQSQDFADLYTGYKAVNNMGKLAETSVEEIIAVGRSLWNMAFSEGITINEVGCLILPSVIMMVGETTHQPDPDDDSLSVKLAAVDKYIQYQKKVIASQQDFNVKYNDFNTRLSSWVSKKKLANGIVDDCFPKESLETGTVSPEIKRRIKSGSIIEGYMNGFSKPCDDAPDSLDKEYENLTRDLSEKFKIVNRFFIKHAFSSIDKSELDFISSAKAKVNSMRLLMYTLLPIITTGPETYYDPNIDVDVKDADIFSVTVGHEERVYALKKDNRSSDSPYKIIRVDRFLHQYIKAGLLNQNFFERYKIEGDKLIANSTYRYRFIKGDSTIEVGARGKDFFVDHFNDKYTNEFYKEFFEKGNDKSQLQKIVSFIKNFIPFYTCIEGAVKKDSAEKYIDACFMDAITLIPVAGFAASLAGRFGMGLARGIRLAGKQLMRGTFSQARTVLLNNVSLPTMSEYIKIGRISLQAIDPGFEFLAKNGRFISNKLIAYLKQEEKGIKLAQELESLSVLQKQKTATEKGIILARLPDSNIDVPVRKIDNFHGKDIYVSVNTDTNTLFGKYYGLSKGNILIQNVDAVLYQKNKRARIDNKDNFQKMDQYDISMRNNNPDGYLVSLPEGITMQKGFLPSTNIPYLHLSSGGTAYVNVSEQPHLLTEHTFKSNQIIQAVKDNYSRDNVYLCRFNQSIESVPNEFSQLQQNIENYKRSVNLAKAHVNRLVSEFKSTMMMNDNGILNYPPRNRIRKYVSDVLELGKITDVELRQSIEREAIGKLRFHAEKISKYLNHEVDNIYFASSHTVSNPYLTNEKGVMAFILRDDVFRRIVIMVDNFHVADQIGTRMYLTTLHEASHFSGSLDFHIAPSTSQVGDASEFMESFVDGIHGRNGESIAIDYKFLEAYRQQFPNISINEVQFKEILKVDPMLRANAFMENADFLARMISDLGSGRAFNSDTIARVSRSAPPLQFDMMFILYKCAIENSRTINAALVEVIQ